MTDAPSPTSRARPQSGTGRREPALRAHVDATFTAPGADPFAVDAAIDVAPGETLVVLGPSGSGKSLLLESLAGLHSHDGHVTLDGRDVTDAPPEAREFGFVFQDYALFPHLTVRENVAFGQRYRDRPVRPPRNERPDPWPDADLTPAVVRVNNDPLPNPDDLLADLGVPALADRSPPTLSGGERQRVALARSLAVDPSAVLLDEPLSALDVPTQESLREDLAAALADVTAVYVTHDRTTARALGDRVAVMHDGRIEQVGTPDAVFDDPGSAFVARFTGANVFDVADLPADASLPTDTTTDDATGLFAIRPEYVVLDPADPVATGEVVRVRREDAGYRATIILGDATIDVHAGGPPRCDTVGVGFPADHLHPVAP